MNHRTIGLISTMSPDNTWAKEVLERVAVTHNVIKNALEDMGFDVLDEGPLHRTYEEMRSAGRSLRARGINALVIYVGTWTYANCAAAAALEADVPVVIWGDATPGTCGLVGGAIARGAMAELGCHAHLVYGLFDDDETRKKVKCLLNAACAAKGLRGQVLGVGGGRSMGMVTAVCDPNEVRVKFGTEIDSFEQMEVIDRAEAIDNSRAFSFLQWMKDTFGKLVASEDVIIKQIKLYLALKELSAEKGYDFIAVKCLPELPRLYTTFCLAHAIMGDAEDDQGPKERFIFACEADLNGALTMQILKMLADGPVLFTDLTEFNLKDNVLTTCNCGSQPTDFAKCKKDVYWEREGVHEFKWRYGGTCPQHVARPGHATVARLSRESEKYEMLIAPVEVVELPRERLRETIWERPHAFLKLLCNRNEFIDAVRSNHLHMVYGDWIAELVEVCEILDFKPVVVK
ncbi:MAG: hypothetical protein HPY71_11590 [Firmicutes bacterium]|nr:hypothetical protein [Bacillota bacterium]